MSQLFHRGLPDGVSIYVQHLRQVALRFSTAAVCCCPLRRIFSAYNPEIQGVLPRWSHLSSVRPERDFQSTREHIWPLLWYGVYSSHSVPYVLSAVLLIHQRTYKGVLSCDTKFIPPIRFLTSRAEFFDPLENTKERSPLWYDMYTSRSNRAGSNGGCIKKPRLYHNGLLFPPF